jgi:hypothetical protein
MPKLFAVPLPRIALPLVGVLLLALMLRVWGLGWGLPSATHYFSYHPDESIVLERASSPSLSVFAGHLLPGFYRYGSLQLYLVCFANTFAALAGAIDIVPKDYATWYPHWAKMYLVGRLLTVGMGVGTVWIVYEIGVRLWGHRAGLLAALVLAIGPLHAQHSHFLTVDVPATFWGMLSLLWAVRLAKGEPKPWRAALWAGVFAGLAAATKYNLALAILPLCAACGTIRYGKGLVTGLAGFALAFFAACPGAILENRIFWHDLRAEAIHVQNRDDPTFRDTGNGFLYHITHNLDAGLGLPLLLLTLAAVGYALYRRQRGDGLLAAFALPYYVLISLAAVRYARYTIPLLPILALWTGHLLAEVSRLPRPAVRNGLLGISGVALAAALAWTVQLVLPMAGVDPRDAALARVAQLASPSARVGFAAMPWFGTPPFSPYFSAPQRGAWQRVISPSEAARIVYNGKDWDAGLLETQKPDVVVLSEYDYLDALRLKDPVAQSYFAVLRRDYQRQDKHQDEIPTRGLPHDMLYTNPIISLYTRNPYRKP